MALENTAVELYSFSDYADTDISQTRLKDITLNSTIRKKSN